MSALNEIEVVSVVESLPASVVNMSPDELEAIGLPRQFLSLSPRQKAEAVLAARVEPEPEPELVLAGDPVELPGQGATYGDPEFVDGGAGDPEFVGAEVEDAEVEDAEELSDEERDAIAESFGHPVKLADEHYDGDQLPE